MIEVVRALPPVECVLELAGGTGIWTKELVKTARSVTVLDASPEMIAINQKKVGSDRVQYRLADLFNWQPDAEYDLVFFAFWISHVPPDQLLSFLERVRQSVRVGGRGRLMMIDEFQVLPEEVAVTEGIYQARTLMDGRQYTIVKVYYDPNNLKEHLTALGFENISYAKGDYFFHLSATRA
jgi:ubiquinone/menaquinone biosynthesis C-methylase UbiE